MTSEPTTRRRLLFILNDASFFVSHRLSIAAAAREAGLEVHVAVAYDASAVSIIEATGVHHHDIPLRRGARNPLGELRLILRLARIIRLLRPDLVHTVTMKPVLYGGSIARLMKVPAVVNAVTGLGYLFLLEGALAKLQRGLIKHIYRFALRQPNGCTIFQNPDDLDMFVNEELVKPQDSTIIGGTGVDMNQFQFLPEPDNESIVMFPARVIGDKGIHEFVAAAKKLKDEGHLARFVIVGRTAPDNPADVGEPKIREWERDGVVEWWGFSNDMANTLPKALIVCMPSYREGSPRALIEAAACGRPIVTADVPGCREIVRHGENGFLVPVRDSAATAHAISKLLSDEELRRQMSRRSRKMAEQEYAMDHFIAKTFAIYEKLIPGSLQPKATNGVT